MTPNKGVQRTRHKVSGPLTPDVGHKKMKRITIALFIMTLAATVSSAADWQWFQKHITERYTPEVRSILMPAASAAAKDSFNTESTQWQYIYNYYRGYLRGLENTRGTMRVGDAGGPEQAGFDAGLRHYQNLLSTTNQPFTLVDFGYEPITATGTYEWGFENSAFRPNGTNENWWVDFQAGVTEAFSEKHPNEHPDLFANRRSCTLKGFLSPDNIGFTGHFNQYDRDFIVSEIIMVGPEPSTQDIKVEIQ